MRLVCKTIVEVLAFDNGIRYVYLKASNAKQNPAFFAA